MTPTIRPEDIEREATEAQLRGSDKEAAELWTAAHRAYLDAGDVRRALRCAFWLAFGAQNMGELARGGGWLARAQRLLDDLGEDCVERGYLLFPGALQHVLSGRIAEAYDAFARATEIGERFGDATLTALGRLGQGRALLHLDRVAEGLSLLDEVMVAIGLGEVSSLAIGTIYCSAIEGCYEVFDLQRAQEWTAALTQWCESQPEFAPYRGQCLVRRAEILQLHGAWHDARSAVSRACAHLAGPPVNRAIGAAYYQQAELHRLAGDLERAEVAYRQASESGRRPQPGLALLRLEQGQVDAAMSSIRGALNDTADPAKRATLLAAAVEIMIAAGDVPSARAAANDLARGAAHIDAPVLRALSLGALGTVLLAEGATREAIGALRQSFGEWCDLDAPYEAARVRTLIAEAGRLLGDTEESTMELDAALRCFERLGAAPDAARVRSMLDGVSAPGDARLSPRELEVLRLVANGRTNRAIAGALQISEKTVARHMSNIFTKLGLTSRAAATGYAYEHGLVSRETT